MVNVDRFRDGMQRQLAALRDALAEGMPRAGWKIGINVPEVQQRLGLPHAGTGWLNGARVYETGRVLRAPADSKLHVEAEAAVRMAGAVSATDDLVIARERIGAVHPALEIVDYARPTSSLDDLIGHSMFHYGAVLGDPVPLTSWRSLAAGFPHLLVGDRSTSTERSDLVPRDLGEVVRFVAQFLGEFGMRVEEGDVILAGSYMPTAVPVSACGAVQADFSELGSVEVELAPGEAARA